MQDADSNNPLEGVSPALNVHDIDTAASRAPHEAEGARFGIDEDWPAAFRKVTFERDQIAEELAEARKKLRTAEILDELIEPYASKAYRFMCVYCALVWLMLIMHGFQTELLAPFSLPDSVLNFLVGSTAVTVIGLVGMVLTGIFVGARK